MPKRLKHGQRRRPASFDLEESVAKAMGGERIKRDSFGMEVPDIEVHDYPYWKVDCKLRKSPMLHSLIDGVATKYCGPADIPVLVTAIERQVDPYVTLPLSELTRLMECERELGRLDRQCRILPKECALVEDGEGVEGVDTKGTESR